MILLPICGIIIILLISGLRIAQEYQRSVIFRLGRFQCIKGPGLYWIVPFIDRQQRVDIRTKTVDLEQQETITKDSVTIKVNAVLWFKITNPEDAIIKVADYNKAVYQFSVTALRNIIGQHSLDEVLREREQINAWDDKESALRDAIYEIEVEVEKVVAARSAVIRGAVARARKAGSKVAPFVIKLEGRL